MYCKNPGAGAAFIPNKGQWPETVEYAVDIPGGKIFFGRDGLLYGLHESVKHPHGSGHGHGVSAKQTSPSARPDTAVKKRGPKKIKGHFVQVDFAGAKGSKPEMETQGLRPEKRNYFLGDDRAKWATEVPAYRHLYYRDVYPKIDLHFYVRNNRLKYEFIVHPGGDPNAIKLHYRGADSLFLQNGDLHVQTSVGTIIEQQPYSFQKEQEEVASRFNLSGDTLSFAFPDGFDSTQVLTIDPSLIFSTYSGAQSDNWGNTAAFDSLGHAYSGGVTFDENYFNGDPMYGQNDFPVTPGAFQENFGGMVDIALLKYTPDGTGVKYITYIGGSSVEIPFSMKTDQNNDLIIMGTTGSSDFPIDSTAYDPVFNGGRSNTSLYYLSYYFSEGTDLFVFKLSEDGSTRKGGTFLGGTDNDGILYSSEAIVSNYGDELRGEVITDDQNNIYMASHTESLDFPILNGFGAVYSGGDHDGVVAKLSPDLSQLEWSTYLGGSSDDAAFSLKLDSLKNVLVTGVTGSLDFPGTAAGLHPTNQGRTDGFLARIDSSGALLHQATYLGTNTYDLSYFVQLDDQDNVYVVGQTYGDYPVTDCTYTNPNSGVFVHSLTPGLDTSRFSTVLGAGNNQPDFSPTAFLVNRCNNIFISGWGGSVNDINSSDYPYGYVKNSTYNLPLTSDPESYQTTTDGSDFYLMVLSDQADTLLYSTYMGSLQGDEHVDGGTSRFDKRGIVYQSVCACRDNSTFPTTPGAWSRTNDSDNCNNALFKFDFTLLDAKFDVQQHCDSLGVSFRSNSQGAASLEWEFGDGTTSKRANPHHVYDTSGTYIVTLKGVDLTTCRGIVSYTDTITVELPEDGTRQDTSVCDSSEAHMVPLSASGGQKYHWYPSKGLTDTTGASTVASVDSTVTYYVDITTDSVLGCTKTDSVTVRYLDPQPRIGFEKKYFCKGKPPEYAFQAEILDSANAYMWELGDGSGSDKAKPVHQYSGFGDFPVTLTVRQGRCKATTRDTLHPEPVKIPNMITPNNDGKNESFAVKGVKGWTLKIFNRWGKPLYKKENYVDDWEAENLPDGTYFYKLSAPENPDRYCKGWIKVIR